MVFMLAKREPSLKKSDERVVLFDHALAFGDSFVLYIYIKFVDKIMRAGFWRDKIYRRQIRKHLVGHQL